MQFIRLFIHATILSFFLIIPCLKEVAASPSHTQQFIAEAVEQHALTQAAESKLEAATERRKASKKDWYPTLELYSSVGRENIKKPGNSTALGMTNSSIGINQQLWDFGATRAKMNKADLEVEKAKLLLKVTREEIILQSLSALINYRKTAHILKFSHKSENNIRKQTGMEEIMVRAGAGYTTDILQAKTQLAGAAARRITAQLAVNTAISQYLQIFPNTNPKQYQHTNIRIPEIHLPHNLAEAEKVAKRHNGRLLIAQIEASISQEAVARTKSEAFAPKLRLKVEKKWQHNVSGLRGNKEETLGKIEFSMPLNLGLTGFNEINAALSDEDAARFKVEDSYNGILNKVRQAWYHFQSSRQLYNARTEQASIAAAFLDLARKERKLGKRSLIDVLSGETSLINAQSDAVAAKSDLTISGYNLLAIMGVLKIRNIVTQ